MRIETPTAIELAQYAEAVEAGVDPEVARQDIWPSRRFDIVLSLVHPEGHNEAFIVGWADCGTCLQHVRNCKCVGGPKEPAYITSWRPYVARVVSTPVETRKLTGRSYLSTVVREDFEEDDRNENPEAYGESFEADHG